MNHNYNPKLKNESESGKWIEEHTPDPSQEGNYPTQKALPGNPQEGNWA